MHLEKNKQISPNRSCIIILVVIIKTHNFKITNINILNLYAH